MDLAPRLPFGTRTLGEAVLEPTLMVIGLNYRTALVSVRERFWMSESQQYEALIQLARAEGIEEVIVLATCNRTEFLLWTSDPGLAANSVLRFLTNQYGLKLCEWKHFYRLLDEAALLHIFRVASSLDSMILGEPQIIAQVKHAWEHAHKVDGTGRFLDAVLQKALTVSKRVRNETSIGNFPVSVPYAAVELDGQILGSLEGKRVLLLGAGKMSELSARYLVKRGARSVTVINRTYEHALELAQLLGGIAVPFENRWQHLVAADIVISSTSCPHFVLSREDTERISRERAGRPLVLVDIAMPRDIDPAVREVKGVFLYDLDDLERVVEHNTGEREAAALEAQKIVEDEAVGFRHRLLSERVVPTIVALRGRLDQICRQELQSFQYECGPFSKDQNELLEDVVVRITRKIAGSLARELKELPEKVEQDQMTVAVQRLFHLETPEKAAAGARH
jgi:glutamyl-tRNA reductase